MISTNWILLWAFVFNDGHIVNHDDILQSKESCIKQAKLRWSDYYKNEMDTVSKFSAICKNPNNHYEFIKIVCSRNGICND